MYPHHLYPKMVSKWCQKWCQGGVQAEKQLKTGDFGCNMTIFGHIWAYFNLIFAIFHIKRLKTPIGVHFGVHFGVHGVHKHLNSESFPMRPHIPIFHGIFCNPIKPYYAQSVDFEYLETHTSHSTHRDLSNETIHAVIDRG